MSALVEALHLPVAVCRLLHARGFAELGSNMLTASPVLKLDAPGSSCFAAVSSVSSECDWSATMNARCPAASSAIPVG